MYKTKFHKIQARQNNLPRLLEINFNHPALGSDFGMIFDHTSIVNKVSKKKKKKKLNFYRYQNRNNLKESWYVSKK